MFFFLIFFLFLVELVLFLVCVFVPFVFVLIEIVDYYIGQDIVRYFVWLSHWFGNIFYLFIEVIWGCLLLALCCIMYIYCCIISIDLFIISFCLINVDLKVFLGLWHCLYLVCSIIYYINLTGLTYCFVFCCIKYGWTIGGVGLVYLDEMYLEIVDIYLICMVLIVYIHMNHLLSRLLLFLFSFIGIICIDYLIYYLFILFHFILFIHTVNWYFICWLVTAWICPCVFLLLFLLVFCMISCLDWFIFVLGLMYFSNNVFISLFNLSDIVLDWVVYELIWGVSALLTDLFVVFVLFE